MVTLSIRFSSRNSLIHKIVSSNHRNELIYGFFSSVISDHQIYITSVLYKYTQFKRHSKFTTKQNSHNLDLFSRYYEDSLNNATFNQKHDANSNNNYSILESALSHSRIVRSQIYVNRDKRSFIWRSCCSTGAKSRDTSLVHNAHRSEHDFDLRNALYWLVCIER